MNRRAIKYLLFTCFTAIASMASGQEVTEPLRPVTSSYVLGVGGARLADTYLTPIIYKGWGVNFDYSRLQAMKFSPEKWVMQLSIGGDIAKGLNPVKNSTMWEAMIHADWAMMRRWTFPCLLTLGAGGFTGIEGGALYNSRNGNNPAAAKGSWTIGARAYATYPFKIGRIRMLARWQGSLPVTGIFLSPEYGELYYEIYLGNHSGLVHGAWWGNYFRTSNEFSVDICCGTNWLRLGYRNDLLSTRVNDITSRLVKNYFVIGLSGEWISWRANRGLNPAAKVISALY